MPSVRDVDATKFVRAYALHLKRSGKLEVPEWTEHVKTGTHKELAPYDPDWFYVRTAALARHLYIRPDAGVGAFKTVFGGRKRNGVRPAKSCQAGGSIIRKALQALEAMKLVAKGPRATVVAFPPLVNAIWTKLPPWLLNLLKTARSSKSLPTYF